MPARVGHDPWPASRKPAYLRAPRCVCQLGLSAFAASRCNRPKARDRPHDLSVILIHLAWGVRHSVFMPQTSRTQSLSWLLDKVAVIIHTVLIMLLPSDCVLACRLGDSYGLKEVGNSERSNHPTMPDPTAHFPACSKDADSACQT